MENFWNILVGFIAKMVIIAIPVIGYAIECIHPESFAFGISAIVTYVLIDVYGKHYNNLYK